MNRKILAHTISAIVGVLLAYYTHKMPMLPRHMYDASLSELWIYHLQNYWWLMLIFFVVGYGITFGIFYFFNKNK